MQGCRRRGIYAPTCMEILQNSPESSINVKPYLDLKPKAQGENGRELKAVESPNRNP